MPTLLALVQKSAEYLAQRGVTNARTEAEWIFSETMGMTRIELYTKYDMPVEERDVAGLRELVQRRGRREPLAYVLKNQSFCGLKLAVGPGVLVPRPETEELVERILAENPNSGARVVDIGTGSGAIALAMKHDRPGWQVEGTDISVQALDYARVNAKRLGLAVEFRECDLGGGLLPAYDLIAANLPYIAESERQICDPELAFEPREALFADDEGLSLMRKLIEDAQRLLASTGVMWLEHGWKQGDAVRACATACRFLPITFKDRAGHERFCRIARA
jgi:release factor glutamine methyltransferase